MYVLRNYTPPAVFLMFTFSPRQRGTFVFLCTDANATTLSIKMNLGFLKWRLSLFATGTDLTRKKS